MTSRRMYNVRRNSLGQWRVLCRRCWWCHGYTSWPVAMHAVEQHHRAALVREEAQRDVPF